MPHPNSVNPSGTSEHQQQEPNELLVRYDTCPDVVSHVGSASAAAQQSPTVGWSLGELQLPIMWRVSPRPHCSFSTEQPLLAAGDGLGDGGTETGSGEGDGGREGGTTAGEGGDRAGEGGGSAEGEGGSCSEGGGKGDESASTAAQVYTAQE